MLRAWFAALSIMAAGVAAATSTAPSQNPPGQPTLELAGGRWFDGQTFVERNWYAVGGRLTSKAPARVDAKVNLAGRYVLPPFAEAHNHDVQGWYLAAISASRYLRDGIFYSAQMCADDSSIKGFRRLFGQPNTVDVLFATACVTASDGHPLGLLLNDYKQEGIEASVDEIREKSGAFYIDTPAELEAKWESIAATRTPTRTAATGRASGVNAASSASSSALRQAARRRRSADRSGARNSAACASHGRTTAAPTVPSRPSWTAPPSTGRSP